MPHAESLISFRVRHGKVSGRSAALFDERSVGAIFFLSSVLGIGVVLLGLYEDVVQSSAVRSLLPDS